MPATRQATAVFVDRERVERVRAAMVGEDEFRDLAETFKAIGDVTRTKMLYVLAREELCVGDIAALLGLTPSAISHQLRLLRSLKLVRHHRRGKSAYYALDDRHIGRLLLEGLRHVTGEGDGNA